MAEVRSLLQSEGRKVGYEIFGGQIHKHPNMKERGDRRRLPVPFPVDSVELTHLEQRCKKDTTLKSRLLQHLNFPLHCSLFPAAWLKSRFWPQVMLEGILPLISLRLVFEISRNIITEFLASQCANLQHCCNVSCSHLPLITLCILWCVTMPVSLDEPQVYTSCIFLIFWDLKSVLFLL